MTRNRFGFTLFIVVIICVMHPEASLAIFDITAASVSSRILLTDVLNNPSQQQFTDSDSDNSLDGEPKDVSANAIGNYGRAFADVTTSAHAQVGDLGVKFLGNGDDISLAGYQAQMDVGATASWRDTGRFSSDLQISTVVFNVLLAVNQPVSLPTHAGGFSLTTDSGGSMNADYEIDSLSSFYQIPPSPYQHLGLGANTYAHFQQDASGPGSMLNFPAPELIPVRLAVCNGCDVELGFRVTLRGLGSTGFTGSTFWSGDFFGSLQWAGVDSVTDQNGNPISRDHWSITSDSGFDYSKPFGAPEPSSILLFGSMLSIVVAFRRTRIEKPSGGETATLLMSPFPEAEKGSERLCRKPASAS